MVKDNYLGYIQVMELIETLQLIYYKKGQYLNKNPCSAGSFGLTLTLMGDLFHI